VAALLAGMGVMGADLVPLSLRPLKYLGIGFPAVLGYTHIIVPGAMLLSWLVIRHRFPITAGVASVIVCAIAISAVPKWADRQVDQITNNRWIDGDQLRSLESRIGFKVWEQGGSSGVQLSIAKVPGHVDLLTAELKRRGVYRP
jgi:hypothetical protein